MNSIKPKPVKWHATFVQYQLLKSISGGYQPENAHGQLSMPKIGDRKTNKL